MNLSAQNQLSQWRFFFYLPPPDSCIRLIKLT
jgi:hypothetical protein